tara:strand:+ start:2275 stop:3042 length:768 start_codon:yes stop_codon:yes gene_type:complete
MKPTYLCIGVQKGGTTSLIRYLNDHPEIFMNKWESHFFDRTLSDGELTENDIEQYEKSLKTNKLIVGEKTPSYCYLRYAIDRIYNYNINMKLIIILREPISRAFSQYNMGLNNQKKDLNDVNNKEILKCFRDQEKYNLSKLVSNGDYHIVRGYYDEILDYILSKFPRENIYIGISEEIKEDKLRYYNEIFEFLGARKCEDLNENQDTHIKKYERPIPKELEERLYNIYKSHNEKLYEILGRKIDIWENYYNQLAS